jgi:hypothetical protein
VYTCLSVQISNMDARFQHCVVFSFEFQMCWPTTLRVISCLKDWLNLVKSSVALFPACFLAKSSLADFQAGGNCVYQGHKRVGSDAVCILFKRVPLHGTPAVRPCSVLVRTVTKLRFTPWCPQVLVRDLRYDFP